ncbi:methyltransferase domain-containing protein [Actinokineospora sp. G85]|uniref:methyltransferase domain-containing protein n=1 Tax=Actinokineospora sp. G85 TaxID=3406626 RepID=UPI003C736FBF
MGAQQRHVQTKDVGELYDQITELPTGLLGDNHHFGYFRDGVAGQTMEVAADHLTDLLIERMALAPGQRVLDVGCGTGRPAVRTATTAGVDVVGITVSGKQLAISRERARREGKADQVDFQLVDAMSLPFAADSFDAALAIESLVHMPDHARVLRQIAGVLKPGGRLVGAHPVLRTTGSGDDAEFLRRFYELFEITDQPVLEDYPRYLAEAGLRLTYLEDVYERVMPPSLAAMDTWIADNGDELRRSGMSQELVEQMRASMRRFSDLPNVGFALFTATPF